MEEEIFGSNSVVDLLVLSKIENTRIYAVSSTMTKNISLVRHKYESNAFLASPCMLNLCWLFTNKFILLLINSVAARRTD